MQGSIVPIVGNRLEFVGSFRIYLTAQGELCIPIGNCRVYVEDEQARAFLEDLLDVSGSQLVATDMMQVRSGRAKRREASERPSRLHLCSEILIARSIKVLTYTSVIRF